MVMDTTMEQQNQELPYEEKRRAFRIAKSFPLTLLDSSKILLDMESKLLDISEKGLGFTTLSPRAPGEVILFRVDVPGEGLVAGKAVTRWCRPDVDLSRYFAGAKIESFAWGHAAKIRRYLAPRSGRGLEHLDLFLMAACVVLGLLIIQNHALSGSSALNQRLLEMFTWLPQAGIVIVGLAGMFLLFRDK